MFVLHFPRIFAATSFGMVINLIRPLLWAPVFIYFVGAESYADWVYVFTLMFFHELLNFGIVRYLFSQLQIVREKEPANFEQLMSISLAFLLILFMWYCLVYALALWWLQGFLPNPVQFEIAAYILLGNIFSTVTGYLANYFKAAFQYHSFMLFRSGFNAVGSSVVILALYLFSDVIIAAKYYVLAAVVECCYMFILGYRKRLLPKKVLFDAQKMLYILKNSISYTLPIMTIYVRNALPIFMIELLFAKVAVLIFSLNRTLITSVQWPINVCISSLVVDITSFYSKGQIAKVVQVFEISLLAIFIFVLVIIWILLPIYPSLLQFWVPSIANEMTDYAILMALAFIFLGHTLWYSSCTFLWSLNKHNKLNLLILGFIVAFCTLSLVLYQLDVSLIQYMYALTILEWLTCITVLSYIAKVLNIPYIVLVKILLLFALCLSTTFVIFWFIPQTYALWFKSLLSAVLVAVIILPTFYRRLRPIINKIYFNQKP